MVLTLVDETKDRRPEFWDGAATVHSLMATRYTDVLGISNTWASSQSSASLSPSCSGATIYEEAGSLFSALIRCQESTYMAPVTSILPRCATTKRSSHVGLYYFFTLCLPFRASTTKRSRCVSVL